MANYTNYKNYSNISNSTKLSGTAATAKTSGTTAKTATANAAKGHLKPAARYNYGFRVLAKDVMVSNDSYKTKLNNSDLVIGGSGAGKTTGYCMPNIENIDGSLIICDTKRQLERHYLGMLKNKGYSVYTLDFVSPEHSTCSYNPLRYIRKNKDGSYREQDVLTLAKLICPAQQHDEPIWDLSAQSLVAFYIAYCLETEKPENQNLMTVSRIHREFCQPNGEVPFLMHVSEHPDSFASKKYFEISANRKADKMFSSIVGFVNVALAPFEFKEAEYIFAEHKRALNIISLGQKKTVLFLNLSDTDSTFNQLINILYTQALQLLCAHADANPTGELDVPVRFMMDDFAASGAAIPDFDKIISVIRSRNISVSIILQSLSQLEAQYGQSKSLTIINNCDHILFLGGNDLSTANFIATRVCKTPESILTMPRDKAYLITSGQHSQLVNKIMAEDVASLSFE